ncbi:hypothetical protein NP493_383g01035 [Ridgeia piscesae]|uniref:Uncharacterized protein n=1 Tax=Ridgeia piscesae TaxID=27915 RepID=A0AAD9L1N1_RIDPI|nr:hypothetical protein NP493_383g01035 [Ridgeia piscesae]
MDRPVTCETLTDDKTAKRLVSSSSFKNDLRAHAHWDDGMSSASSEDDGGRRRTWPAHLPHPQGAALGRQSWFPPATLRNGDVRNRPSKRQSDRTHFRHRSWQGVYNRSNRAVGSALSRDQCERQPFVGC